MSTKPPLCIAVRLRRKALHAALSRCQACQKSLVIHRTVEDPEERHTFAAHVWNDYPCWNCSTLGPIILVFRDDHSGERFISTKVLGEAIRKLFPLFYPDYSATMEKTYYANHCPHCRALQGDHPLLEWAMSSGRWDTPDAITPIPDFVEVIPAETYDVDAIEKFHVVFADGDKSNKTVGNLKVLCEACYAQVR